MSKEIVDAVKALEQEKGIAADRLMDDLGAVSAEDVGCATRDRAGASR